MAFCRNILIHHVQFTRGVGAEIALFAGRHQPSLRHWPERRNGNEIVHLVIPNYQIKLSKPPATRNPEKPIYL